MTTSPLKRLTQEQQESLSERLLVPNVMSLQFLGKGGFAHTYWLPDRKRVFKITKDKEDANASEIVKDKKTTHIVRTYDVFQINKTYYGIVNEKLTPLSPSKQNKWKALTDLYYEDVNELDIPMLSQTGLVPQWVMDFKDAVFASSYAEQAENLEDEFDELLMFAEELSKYGIKWRDWHYENIMNRGRTPVISDLGGGTKSPHSNIPTL